MNDSERQEGGPILTAALMAWREEPVPSSELTAALERIARRRPRWPVWPVLPGLAAAITLAVLLTVAPDAWAAVAAGPALRAEAGAAVDDAALRARLRPLLIVHVVSLLAGYALFFVVWLALQFEALLHLLGVRRWRARVTRWAPWGVAGGAALWALGIVLGGAWASSVMGRFWGWDEVEVQALIVFAVSATWLALAWHCRQSESLVAAWSSLLFWVLLDLVWGGLHALLVPARGYRLQPPVIVFFLAGACLNVLWLASAWYAGRRKKCLEGPAG